MRLLHGHQIVDIFFHTGAFNINFIFLSPSRVLAVLMLELLDRLDTDITSVSAMLSVQVPAYLLACLPDCLSTFLTVCLSVCQSVYLFTCMSVFLHICTSAYVFACQYICLPVCLHSFLSDCLLPYLLVFLTHEPTDTSTDHRLLCDRPASRQPPPAQILRQKHRLCGRRRQRSVHAAVCHLPNLPRVLHLQHPEARLSGLHHLQRAGSGQLLLQRAPGFGVHADPDGDACCRDHHGTTGQISEK